MPINLVDADTFDTPVQAAADGDAANSANLALGHQDLANRTNYLHNRLFGRAATTRRFQVPLNGAASASANWIYDTTNLWWEDIANTTDLAWYYWNRPVSGRIVAFHVTAQGVGHIALPAVMPSVQLFRIDRLAGGNILVGTATDPSGNAAALDAVHEYPSGALAEDILLTRAYVFVVHGETGVNSQPDHRFMQLAVEVDPAVVV